MARHQTKKLREIAGMILLLTSLLIILSLVTYHPKDASLSVSTSIESTHNFIGKVGAWISDFLFQFIGISAFIIAIPLLVASVKLIFKKPFQSLFSHFFGVFLLILSIAGLAQIWQIQVRGETNFAPGGILGGNLIEILKNYLNHGGAVLVLVSFFIIGILLVTTRTLDDLWAIVTSVIRRISRKSPKSIAESPSSIPGTRIRKKKESRRRKDHPDVSNEDGKSISSLETIPITRLELKDEFTSDNEKILTITERRRFSLPKHSLLSAPTRVEAESEVELWDKARQLIEKYAEFGINGSISAIHPGPVVTLFEFKPAPGVKYSRMLTLVDDLCLGLKAVSIRIDRIPGKSTVGIEVPNTNRQEICIRELLESKEFQRSTSPLTLALGKRINGDVYVTDLSKMPHLLVAGSTGSGKSVGLNTMITSILYKSNPDLVKFILIDPKRLELSLYADIPNLLTPIVTDAKMAANTLIWAVHEMEERYKLLAKYAVRDINHFNKLCEDTDELTFLPFVVIVIDELAELLSVASKEVEICLQRLAQMARAVGIHLIIATQRPSVEVITGTIKANFPSRISYSLLSRHDSKTILDTIGAENLLGKGDMLFLPPRSAKLIRIHGGNITDPETKRVVDFLTSFGEPQYKDLNLRTDEEISGNGIPGVSDDPLYEEVAQFIVKQRKASTSVLQRRFRIGYGRAARLMDILEDEGLVGEVNGSRPRDVLVPPDYFDEVDGTREDA